MRKTLTALAFFTFIGLGAVPALAEAPLVDAAWVQANACQARVVVIDIRENPRAFARGHVPCAVFSPYRASGWRQEVDGVIGMLPPPGVLAKLIGGLGVGNDSHVVIVGAGGRAIAMTGATRVYWTFKVLGHDKVSLLDGGMAAYRDAGAKLEKGDAPTPATVAFAVAPRPDMVATAADVQAAIGGGATLVDSRESDQHMGINHSPIAAPGTIPGATNMPISWLTAPDGRFHSRAALQNIAGAVGLEADAPVVTFCTTGQMASLDWFVAHELLGNAQARMYDGSMTDWTADASRPVERKVVMP